MNEERKEDLQCLQERFYAAITNEKIDCEEMSSVSADDRISPELEAWLSYVMPN